MMNQNDRVEMWCKRIIVALCPVVVLCMVMSCHLTPAQDAALAAGGAALCRALVPVAGGSPELAVEACAGAEAIVSAALAAAQPSIPAAPSPPAGKPRVALVANGVVVGYAPSHAAPWVQAAIDAR